MHTWGELTVHAPSFFYSYISNPTCKTAEHILVQKSTKNRYMQNIDSLASPRPFFLAYLAIRCERRDLKITSQRTKEILIDDILLTI